MSRVQLSHPRFSLFGNCVLSSPYGGSEYSVSTEWNRGFAGRTATICSLPPFESGRSSEIEDDVNDEKALLGFNENMDENGTKTMAKSKTVIASINFHNPYRGQVTVESQNRQRMTSSSVGLMRRNLQNVLVRNADGTSVMLDVGGSICECIWVRANYHTRELRIMSSNELVVSVREEEVGFIGDGTLSPQTHITIHPDVVANYLSNAYSDVTPRISVATAMQKEIVEEILIAYVLSRYPGIECRIYVPRIFKESAKFLKGLFGRSNLGKSNAMTANTGDELAKDFHDLTCQPTSGNGIETTGIST